MAGGNPQLTPAAFQTLLALANGRGGRAHGYAIMGFVDTVSGGAAQLGPGTLYRTLARLVADGLVEEAQDESEDQPHDSRRRYYRLTPAGREVAAREAEFLSRLVAVAGQAGLLKRAESA
ncbi:PadR family transcriptional regulator [Amycolatopsis azurea]|uniref:PadR family transcriptional regulator n=1 Tax=Amycolatopsis azurea DSM 43854 TaxID=1238180 RepID=M2QTG7_9PSEU|nr:PadR family transcriptional regulator [Amycolatopsis azurea]EMD29801.1 Transcriptional regulator, PadR family [Amycolatopsis azurea DSM 43854]OOC07394.1 PadR family transcriptional regulator [Amycolatopsis azurea DSM 43854]